MKKIKMPLLWAIFTTIVFFSCGDAVVDYKIVKDFSFVKLYLESYSNSYIDTITIVGERTTINECMVGDTIGLICFVGVPYPESVTVRIITSGGDEEFIKILDTPDIAYLLVWPHGHLYSAYLPNEDMYPHLPEPFLLSNIPISYKSKPKVRDGILSVSPNGDVITAEIRKGREIIQKTTLNVRSK